MAKRKKGRGRKRSSRSLNGLPKFDAKRISVRSGLDKVGKPILFGLLGAAAGHFAGRGRNLILAGVGGLAALATGHADTLAPAIVGCAVVTPPKAAATVDGLEGLQDMLSGGVDRSKGYVKSLLTNAGLDQVANQINGLGYTDYDEAYEQGYINGADDSQLLEEGYDGINGYALSEGGHSARSIESVLLQGAAV